MAAANPRVSARVISAKLQSKQSLDTNELLNLVTRLSAAPNDELEHAVRDAKLPWTVWSADKATLYLDDADPNKNITTALQFVQRLEALPNPKPQIVPINMHLQDGVSHLALAVRGDGAGSKWEYFDPQQGLLEAPKTVLSTAFYGQGNKHKVITGEIQTKLDEKLMRNRRLAVGCQNTMCATLVSAAVRQMVQTKNPRASPAVRKLIQEANKKPSRFAAASVAARITPNKKLQEIFGDYKNSLDEADLLAELLRSADDWAAISRNRQRRANPKKKRKPKRTITQSAMSVHPAFQSFD